jgi:flavin-dependent dehydrogenase
VESFDVVVVGAGLAGGLLARQLRRHHPELSVLVLDAREAWGDRKVGESTVEVAASYMVRKLGLGTYLYQHQLPKNGLRFFFDDADKSLPLAKMSEIGSDHLPFHPAFQLERATLERDLVAMNRADGATVELGAKVTSIALDAERGHTVTWQRAGDTHTARARWLVDASGRRHLLCRALGQSVDKDERLPMGAAWARYRDVAGFDAVNEPGFRERVRFTSRHLSTNHLMYDGYWIWFIPLAGDGMSVGVVFDKTRFEGPRTEAELDTFLASHRAARELLVGAKREDFQSFSHLAYRTARHFSTDRWALTGDAGSFIDPFYSPGADFIATSNTFITSLISADVTNDPDFAARVDTYDAYYRYKYEASCALYQGLYAGFGSYEVVRLKYLLDFHNYYNLVVWPFLADKLTDLEWLRAELEFAPRVLRILGQMGGHFARLAEHLRERGEYFRWNEGRFANGLAGVSQFETRMGPELDEEFRRAEVARAFGHVFARSPSGCSPGGLLEPRARAA